MPSIAKLATLAAAVSVTEAHYIHSALVFTRHGDRTAKWYKGYQMTNLGAQQVYQSGQFYRERYLTGDHPINGISRDEVSSSQIWASAPDQHVLFQTATNFLQGLYPPLDNSSSAIENLNNGTDIEAPLEGYQFVLIHGEGESDPDTIWIKGDDACPNYDVASRSYRNSAEYQATLEASADFYSKFEGTLAPIMGAENVSYAKAYDVFDLLNVASIHNRTVVTAPFETEPFSIDSADLDQLRYYANEWEWNHNYNASEPDRSIGGMTLAGGILHQLDMTVKGSAKVKFSLMAGSYDTFMSFFGLANLTAASPDFMGLPNYAASMAFELFSDEQHFKEEDLMVRFYFRNGTGESQDLNPFPLFGEDRVDLPYAEFVRELRGRSIYSLEQWCATCAATEDFCVAANKTATATTSSDNGSDTNLSNTAAGGIGAAVTLAVVGLLGAVFWMVRRRKNKPTVGRTQVVVDPEKTGSMSDSGSDRR